MHPRTQNIENTLSKARANLARLQAECDAVLLDLYNRPEDATLLALLDQLRPEIEQATKYRIPELERFLVASKAADTAEARASARMRLEDLRMCADVGAHQYLVKAAAKIDKAVADLGECLVEYAEAGGSLYDHVRLMIAGACPDVDKRLRYAGDLLRLADGSADIFRNALLGQLLSAGVFKTGIPVVDIQLEGLCGGPKITLEQAAELAADRVGKIMGKFSAMADDLYGPLPTSESASK